MKRIRKGGRVRGRSYVGKRIRVGEVERGVNGEGGVKWREKLITLHFSSCEKETVYQFSGLSASNLFATAKLSKKCLSR